MNSRATSHGWHMPFRSFHETSWTELSRVYSFTAASSLLFLITGTMKSLALSWRQDRHGPGSCPFPSLEMGRSWSRCTMLLRTPLTEGDGGRAAREDRRR